MTMAENFVVNNEKKKIRKVTFNYKTRTAIGVHKLIVIIIRKN